MGQGHQDRQHPGRLTVLDYDRILVTGAAGYLGRLVRASLRGRVPNLRLCDIAPMEPPLAGEEVMLCDLADREAVGRALAGVDAVVHLGASLNVDDWQQTLDVNIAGTYNVFEAARRGGARRVVYASSHHAVGMYPITQQIGIDEPLRPDSLYGLSKCFGESTARYFWDKFGLEAVCLRIGSVRPHPSEQRELATWMSEGDFEQLLLACLSAPQIGFSIVYGVSDNDDVWWRNPDAARLGFVARDKAQLPGGKLADGDAAGVKPQYPLQGGKRAAYGLLEGAARLSAKR